MGNNLTFDSAPFNSSVRFDIDISSDRKAFTATFGDVGLDVDLGAKGTAPIVTRAFSFALKLSGAEPNSEIPFAIQGAAGVDQGANGHLLFSVNDQTMVVDFTESSANSFLKQFNYNVGAASELRITVFLWIDRDSTSDAGGTVSVTSIDTDVNKAQP